VPDAGSCAAAAATLQYPSGATFVLARSGRHGLSREETGLLRRMAQVASMTMRMLDVLDNEHSAREEAGRLAREQAALRRVATLVARDVPPEELFAVVTKEAGRVLGTDYTTMGRYDPDGAVTILGGWRSSCPVSGELVKALDGRIFLDSPRAVGTTLRVEIPLTDAGQATPANPPPQLRLSYLFPGSPGTSGQAAAASAAGAGAGAGAMARPPGSSAPASSNSTIPLQSRLHPCSG
jgi:hypothetical protein